MFSEEKYYEAFKKVRNKFRKYRYYELIGEALVYINPSTKDKIELLKRHPWMVILFIKWALIDDNFPNKNGRIASKNDVHTILQSVYEMSDKLRMPNEYDHYSLFLRNIAFQQFLYQTDFYYAHLSRQSILFSKLQENHYIRKEFKKNTGLDIDEFLDLSMMTVTRFLNNHETILPANWFSNVNSEYSIEKTDRFLEIISKDINEISYLLRKKDNRKRLASENYELTPFIDFPLIKVQSGYLLIHRNILFRRLEYMVYDIMRTIDAERFMRKFGGLFERYVEKSIKHSKINYITEKEIQNKLGLQGNQIDFILQETNSNIFIDAKAVEMSSQGKTTHSTEILLNKTTESILKSIKQSHDVIKKISVNKNCGIDSAVNNYLLVITFKELHLGNGTAYYDIIAKKKMDEIYASYKDTPCIPPENMYFMTINEFDILTNTLSQQDLTLSNVIEIAKTNDSNPKTQKLDFIQHLQELEFKPQTSDYLAKEKDKIFDRILNAAKN